MYKCVTLLVNTAGYDNSPVRLPEAIKNSLGQSEVQITMPE